MTDYIDWEIGETREVQWHPQDAQLPDGAIDHGLAPGHHAAHSRLIEAPVRKDTAIAELPEPSLCYLRRASMSAPVELVIVEDGFTFIRPISKARLLRMVADGAGFLASGGET